MSSGREKNYAFLNVDLDFWFLKKTSKGFATIQASPSLPASNVGLEMTRSIVLRRMSKEIMIDTTEKSADHCKTTEKLLRKRKKSLRIERLRN